MLLTLQKGWLKSLPTDQQDKLPNNLEHFSSDDTHIEKMLDKVTINQGNIKKELNNILNSHLHLTERALSWNAYSLELSPGVPLDSPTLYPIKKDLQQDIALVVDINAANQSIPLSFANKNKTFAARKIRELKSACYYDSTAFFKGFSSIFVAEVNKRSFNQIDQVIKMASR